MTRLNPASQVTLYGHTEAEQQCSRAWQQGALPHAWLIQGPKGVGKATFAYRFARFLFKHGAAGKAEEGESLFGDALPSITPLSLALNESDPVFERVAAGGMADLRVLEPTNLDEDGKAKAGFEIRVYQVRKLQQFFSQTASEADWRIAIIDAAEDMNTQAANALLKLLEEPPAHTMLMLISHCPGQLLTTIRSRCRMLSLKPLSEEDMERVMEAHVQGADAAELEFVKAVAAGSPGLALHLLEQHSLEQYQALIHTLSGFPKVDVLELQAFVDSLAAKQQEAKWELMVFMLSWFLASTVERAVFKEDQPEFVAGERALREALLAYYSVDQLSEIWEKVSETVGAGEALNMSKQGMAMELFATMLSKK